MKKSYLMLAAAAALFAACSNDDGVAEAQKAEQQVAAGEVPVGFDTYVNRSTTRAGIVGETTLAKIKAENAGFGVFAYYTNADNYDQSFTPNFMYNQHVKFESDAYTYSPVKYWSNEFGSGAASEDADKISFFAYAPYVSVNPASGKVNGTGTGSYHAQDNGDITKGIVGMKNNSATGDPMVKYISTFYTDQQVDLTWGTASGENWTKKNTGTQTMTAGLPWLNVEHQYTTSTSWSDAKKVNFNFRHALASLNVTVDTKANSKEAKGAEANTKVFIRSVTFEGFDVKGALNLNNVAAEKALWYNFDCLNELNNGSEVTIQDGRKDGKEGVTAATKENAFINPDLVQSGVFDPDTTTANKYPHGVRGTTANLFRTSVESSIAAGIPAEVTTPIYVIPNGDPLKVTIEYDVLTQDNNLAGTLNDGQTKGSVVKNVITRYITIGNSATGSVTKPATDATTDGKGIILENGKKYTIKLHLGLNSVEFDAAVAAWATGLTGGADLPHNN